MSQQINLFNPIFLKQKKYFSALTMVQALGLILLGCALLSGYAQYRLGVLKQDAAATNAQLSQTQSQLQKISATYVPRQKTIAIEDQMHAAQTEVGSLQQVLHTLQDGEIGNTHGYAQYMRAFSRQIMNGIWLTGFQLKGAGSEIELSGRTLQPELVPLYISRLKHEAVLQGKSFATLEMQVPQISPSDTSNPTAEDKPVRPPYIEFSLRSSPASDENAQQAGASQK